MIAFSIESDDIKVFMNKMLKADILDQYDIRLIEIESIAKFTIDCTLNKRSRKWSEIKPFAFNIIKGSQKPKRMKMIFSYDAEALETFHSNAAALFLNVYFEDDKIKCTTGTSQKSFTLEKDLDTKWDHYITEFFEENNIFISTHFN